MNDHSREDELATYFDDNGEDWDLPISFIFHSHVYIIGSLCRYNNAMPKPCRLANDVAPEDAREVSSLYLQSLNIVVEHESAMAAKAFALDCAQVTEETTSACRLAEILFRQILLARPSSHAPRLKIPAVIWWLSAEKTLIKVLYNLSVVMPKAHPLGSRLGESCCVSTSKNMSVIFCGFCRDVSWIKRSWSTKRLVESVWSCISYWLGRGRPLKLNCCKYGSVL